MQNNYFNCELNLKNSSKIVLTGDRPTGPLHLGHYIGSLTNRLKLQDSISEPNIIYIMIADTQALTDNFTTPQKIVDNVYEVAKDYISIGINPELSTIFIQSQVSEISELCMYYMNLVTIGRLERNPTVKNEIIQKKFNESVPAGFFCYPISQAADITAFKGEIIPVGEDQLPIIEQTNEIIRKFNRIYNTNCLVECTPYISKTPRLIGINGKAKASKSLNNAIFLNDNSEIVYKKVYSMYTDPDHLKIGDSGKIEGNVVFTYLDAFHQNQEEIQELKKHYQRGGLGDTTIKSILYKTLESILGPIREKRNNINNQEIKEILFYGTQKARLKARQTLNEVIEAMGLKYFS
ncbi:tryptophan--tRNA ligase [Lyticum sinuosum]|uniref:Tryptophan--tRNA ligase n=1 Tax=Lyticum sinuosum TaxID=1332059 RepID=A0AAE4VLF7_9RICK|nr:tryptophan--tRNA ligase [Lyticum sinuosum]MDZ5760931.1 Tryptophan--tRNA ligase [Lyticum sinuosum]